jgi:hypothetical protein|tara:strand:- start:1765 stop:2421 length:657 start_codon:yes stop_codon:yes gene_type:complete
MNEQEKKFREELYGTTTDLTEAESNCILRRLEEFDTPRYLEIGVWYCGTFCKILNFLNENKKSYQAVGIDLFESIEKEKEDVSLQTHKKTNRWNILNVAFHKHIQKTLEAKGYRNFSLIKGNSDVTVNEKKLEMDLYFIDGNHTYLQTKKDANSCLNFAPSGSYLVFHNASNDQQPDIQYVNRDGGPYLVCEELKSDPRVEFVEKADRCVVFRVIKNG